MPSLPMRIKHIGGELRVSVLYENADPSGPIPQQAKAEYFRLPPMGRLRLISAPCEAAASSVKKDDAILSGFEKI